ncbi:hypothetical protein CR513_59721, partial [Mucuna pruriens]
MRAWEDWLPYVEFGYNRVVNSTTSHSLFELVYCFNPLSPLDLLSLHIMPTWVNDEGLSKAQFVKKLHEKCHNQICDDSKIGKVKGVGRDQLGLRRSRHQRFRNARKTKRRGRIRLGQEPGQKGSEVGYALGAQGAPRTGGLVWGNGLARGVPSLPTYLECARIQSPRSSGLWFLSWAIANGRGGLGHDQHGGGEIVEDGAEMDSARAGVEEKFRGGRDRLGLGRHR